MNRNKRSAVRSALVTVDQGSNPPVTANSVSVTPQAPAAAAQPPHSTQEAEAGVMTLSMQDKDSHANHQKKYFEKHKKEKPKRIITCYNCDTEGHRYTECDESLMRKRSQSILIRPNKGERSLKLESQVNTQTRFGV